MTLKRPQKALLWNKVFFQNVGLQGWNSHDAFQNIKQRNPDLGLHCLSRPFCKAPSVPKFKAFGVAVKTFKLFSYVDLFCSIQLQTISRLIPSGPVKNATSIWLVVLHYIQRTFSNLATPIKNFYPTTNLSYSPAP